MKKLYIIRHAKSSWKDTSLDDFERPLNKRGEKNSKFMGEFLKDKKIMPDVILSSRAFRAKETAKNIAKKIHYTKEIIFDENMYEANVQTLLNRIETIDNKLKSVFVIGHNPGLNMLVTKLVALHENIPTCGIVAIEFSCDNWSEISSSNAKLISFDYPKMFL